MAECPVVVTFDGPKAVGKSTLISLLGASLAATGVRMRTLVEKEAVPASISRLLEGRYTECRRDPGPRSDWAVAQALLEARVWITRNLLADTDGDVILLDRWYPSDVLFRRFLHPSQLVEANLSAGVLVPDLIMAITCDPATSWERAMARPRGLDSKVISNFVEHEEATWRFVAAAKMFGWDIVQTDTKSPQELAETITDRLRRFSRGGGSSVPP